MAADPYASHLPFLRQYGLNVKSVLELGAGLYSTPLFLDKAVFPDLHLLMSVEHVKLWLDHMPQDPRLVTILTENPALNLLPLLNLSTFDLIFVDNAPAESREAVISYLRAMARSAYVIIHDFEYEPYQVAASGFAHVEVDKTLTPWTAMCWND